MTDQFPQPPQPPQNPYGRAPEVPQAPGYGTPPYAQPPLPQAPPGAYGVPVGGYPVSVGDYAVPSAAPKPKLLGALALVASLIALVIVPIVGGSMAFQIGKDVPLDDLITADGDLVLEALSPVRTAVLWGEISFWAGTLLGLFALVMGVIAIARARGRGMGIAALIIAVIGPVVYFFVVSMMWGMGTALGISSVY